MKKAIARFRTFLPFVVASWLSVSPVSHSASATPDPPRVGYLHAGKLYYFQVKDRWALVRRPSPKPHELWQAKMTLEGLFKKGRQFISCLGDAGDRLPDRWRISDGFFWWEEDHESQGGQDHNYEDLWRIPLGKIAKKREGVWYNCTLEPILILRDRAAKCTYFDVIPDRKDEIHVLLALRGEIRVWRGVCRWYEPNEKKREAWMPKKRRYIKWENEISPNEDQPYHDAHPVLRVGTDMREGFFAYQNKTHYFLVTVSGKLYSCRRRGAKQHTELLWNDANSPISTIIHDNASKKTYAFTSAVGRADKPGCTVWFELAPKLKPTAYDPKKIPKWEPSDPLLTMTEYARIILWNVPPFDWHVPISGVTRQQREQWWADLTSKDTVKAHRAAWGLILGAADTVVFLENHLHAETAAVQERLNQLLIDLDSDDFGRREAATRELSRGVLSEAILQKALVHSPSLEVRRRLEAIREVLPEWPMKNPELLRNICAIRVLQRIGTMDAKALLEKVAGGAPSARLTQKAKDALETHKKQK